MTTKDRRMLMVILAVALLGGFYMFVLKPRQAAVKDAQAQVDAAEQTLAAAKDQATSGKAAQEAFQRDRATLLKIGRVVPENDDIPTLQVQLLRLAKKEKVFVTEFTLTGSGSTGGSAGATSVTTPNSTTPTGTGSTDAVAPLYPPGSVQMAGGLGRTPIEIKLKGEFFQLERFLRAVQRYAVISSTRREARGRLLVVDGFSYEGSDRVVGTKRAEANRFKTTTYLKAKLVASVYFAPPVATPSTNSAGAAAAPPTGATPGAASATGTATAGGLQ